MPTPKRQSSDSLEAELLRSPETAWAESVKLESEFAARMMHVRYRVFAEEWRKGKTLAEIAGTFGMPVSNACVFSTRVRKALGERAMPRRNACLADHSVRPVRPVAAEISAFKQPGDYFDLKADNAPKYNTLYVQARRGGWAISIKKLTGGSVRVTAIVERDA